MKKKILSAILSMAVAASLFSGCGAETTTRITIYRSNFSFSETDAEQLNKVADALNSYMADKGMDIEVTLMETSSDVYVETAAEAIANEEVNLLWTAAWEIGDINPTNLVKSESLYDLTSYLSGTALYATIDSRLWETSEFDGKKYFVPISKDNAEGYDLMFRQELVDKYGWDLSSITCLEDLETQGILDDCMTEGLWYPFMLQKTAMFNRFYIDSYDFFTGASSSNWIAIDRNVDIVVNTVLSDEYYEFCSLMAKWSSLGYIDAADYEKTIETSAATTDDWGVSWWTDVPINDEADTRYGQDVTMVKITDEWVTASSPLNSCYCVTAYSSTDQVKACIDFLNLLYTDTTFADIYTYGIEGEDFTYDANGCVEQNSTKYAHFMWESANASVVSPVSGEPVNKGELYETWNNEAKVSNSVGFRFDVTEVLEEYTACQAVYEEYGYLLETGGVAPDDVATVIAEYRDALDAAGYQKVVVEAQLQYDNWKAANGR